MQSIASLWAKYKSVLLYLIFGGLTTLINIGVYALMTRFLQVDYIVSNVVAWIVAVLFAFVTNKLFVFESRSVTAGRLWWEIVSFFGGRLFSLGVDTLILYTGVDVLGWHDLIVKIIANIVVIILNYFISKLLVFRKR